MKRNYDIELPCLVDVWDVDDEGNDILVKGNVIVKRMADLRHLFPEQTVTRKGRIYKGRCRVYDESRKADHLVQMSYHDLKKKIDDALFGSPAPIGFKYEVE